MKIFLNRFFPLILAGLSVAIFSVMILQHEMHLKQAKTIYIALEPVDPRSMLQGDYMRLRYALNLRDVDQADIKNQSSIVAYARLDRQQRVSAMHFQHSKAANAEIRLILKNPTNQLQDLYPAANSFMFAEGLEPCYAQAQFAELKVDVNGKAMLANLLDQNLQSLQCETQHQWREG